MKGPITAISVMAVALFVFLVSTNAAQAHQVTKRDCIEFAWAKGPQTKPIRRARLIRCLDYRARHNICHGVKHCSGWLRIAICESGNQHYALTARNIASIRWTIHNSYEGGLQFSSSSWDGAARAAHLRYHAAYVAPPNAQLKGGEAWRKLIGGNPHTSAGWPICGMYY